MAEFETTEVCWHDLKDNVEACPYPREAFRFVQDGLKFTTDRVHDHVEMTMAHDEHHITGQQLCIGLRDYAIDQYGMLAPAVLSHWKIQRTEDFGRIVFAMIDAGLMIKTDDDDINDFRAVYDFSEAFSHGELSSCMTTK